jgi:hypothetical protein
LLRLALWHLLLWLWLWLWLALWHLRLWLLPNFGNPLIHNRRLLPVRPGLRFGTHLLAAVGLVERQ